MGKKINKNYLTKIDAVTKILLIILVVAISYFVVFLIFRPFFITQPSNMADMMNQIMGSNRITSVNLLSLILALIIGVIISFYLFKQHEEGKINNELNVIKRVLSEDENKILNEIKKAGDITQDSLRFRLDWSKAKISTILTNLDRKGIIQRERIGKTYKVYLEK